MDGSARFNVRQRLRRGIDDGLGIATGMLALNRNVSDIVEMSHGQIRLDTIFIDEGFGSLDTDNDGGTLDLVLNVLQGIVGNSRAVGLISHVPMVQQAVPNGFSIVKSVGGNRIERRIA